MQKDVRAIKLYFHKPLVKDWKEVSPLLNDISYKVTRGLNSCMSEWYMWQSNIERARKKNIEFNLAEARENERTRQYKMIREMFPELYSGLADSIKETAFKKWKNECKDVFYAQRKSLSSYKKGKLIPLHDQSYSVGRINKEVILNMSLFSKQSDSSNKDMKFVLKTQKIDGSTRHVLEQILKGNFVKKAGSLKKDSRGRTYVNIAYEKPHDPIKGLDPEKIVGVDLGVAHSFYCAVNSTLDSIKSEDGHLLERFRNQIRRLRKGIQSSYRLSNSRKGKGRVYALKPLNRLRDKEKRFRDTYCHNCSRIIVDFAAKVGAGIIQMEDLSSMKSLKVHDKFLSGWPIADLQNKIEYKANEYGIEVKKVNPQYTSQRCSSCGHISSENREKMSREFKCVRCGVEMDADYNAAKNLSIRGIDEIIKNANLKLTENLSEVRTNV